MENERARDGLLRMIDDERDELVRLCLDLGNTPSPHGKEREVGHKVLDWLNRNGIPAFFQHITDESVNVVGALRGSGEAPSLILNAHMDTGVPLGPDATEDQRRIEGAWVDGDLIYGKGVINDKAQLCAFMIAARAIRRSGFRLKGDLTIAGVAFETGAASVDETQGINFPGEGFGTKWLVDRGVTADYALVGETSGFGIVKAECGAAWFKIRVKGRETYTPRLERGSTLKDHPNAFVRMAHVVLALEEWAKGYERRERRDFDGGTIVPKAQAVRVRGEGDHCDLYMDVRLVPGKNPREIEREIRKISRAMEIDCEVTMYQFSRGYVAKNAEPLLAALESAHRAVFGSDPPLPPSAEVSMWRDLNVFNEVGIPSLCYGPPRQRETMSGHGNRAMKISDLVAAAKVYALSALSLCGGEKT